MIQMNEPLETAELQALVTAVDAGSLTRAAQELGVPRVTLGRRLTRLEERLGVRLLRRTTRSLGLTDAGEELYRRARQVLEALTEAEQAVRRSDGAVRGLLRVATPPMDNPWMRSIFLEFARAYPGVRLEVVASTAHADLASGRFDVAMRASPTLAPGLVARVLARTPLRAVCSPAYLARAGEPATPEALEDHAALVGFARGEHPQTHWPLLDGAQVRVRPVLASNELGLLRDAALAGVGIALLPRLLVREQVSSGALVEVLPDRVGMLSQIALVYPERELVPPAVRAFVSFVVDRWARVDESQLSAR